jgi:hypothetical protein
MPKVSETISQQLDTVAAVAAYNQSNPFIEAITQLPAHLAENVQQITKDPHGLHTEMIQRGVNIIWYGADPTGVIDSTTAIQNAVATGKNVYIPEGNFKISGTIPIVTSGQRIQGAGRYKTVITSSATGDTFTVAADVLSIEIKDMKITRVANTAASGRDGIRFLGWTNQSTVERVDVTYHWNGMYLSATGYSYVHDCLCDNNYNHGIHEQNTASIGAVQWTISKTLCQRSNGYGLLTETINGPTSCSFGELVTFSTYANKLGGAKFKGSATTPLNAIRWTGGFVGEDGNSGVILDTYGSSTHKIYSVFSEIAGTSACGVDNSTPVTHTGWGFEITANNTDVVLSGCIALGNSYDGINSSAGRISITGGECRLNGAAGIGGSMNGIYIGAGRANITGNPCRANSGFGIYLANDNHVIVGNDLRENTLSGLGAGVTLTVTQDIGNLKV